MKQVYKIILTLSIVLFNFIAEAQFKICDKDDPFTELEWIINYPPDKPAKFSAVELNGEIYIASGSGYHTCTGEIYCDLYDDVCTAAFRENSNTVRIPGLCSPEDYGNPECPVLRSICKGQSVRLSMESINAPYPLPSPPPPAPQTPNEVGTSSGNTVVGTYKFRDSERVICSECYTTTVRPETTTLYKAIWNTEDEINGAPKRLGDSGEGHFLVIVENCFTGLDLYPEALVSPIYIDREGYLDVILKWFSNGSGFLEEVDFIIEVNGKIDSTYKWNQEFDITGQSNISNNGKEFKMGFPYYFESGTEYNFKITTNNPNGQPDLNPENDVLEFTIPAFEAEYDLALEKSINPFNTKTGDVKVAVKNYGNSIVNNFLVRWNANGIEQTPLRVENFDWDMNNTDLVIGNLNLNNSTDYEIEAWIELEEMTDVELKNNNIILKYSSINKNYYNVDQVFTICKGDSIVIPQPAIINFYQDCLFCNTQYVLDTLIIDGILLEQNLSYTGNILVKPNKSTFYTRYGYSTTKCIGNTYDCRHIVNQEYEYVNITYSVIVLDCNKPESELTVFYNYNWLSNFVNPDACNGESVYVYDADTYEFLIIKTNLGESLYKTNGELICFSPAGGFSFIGLYNKSRILDSWHCEQGFQGREGKPEIQNQDIQIFPNPAKDKVFINLQQLTFEQSVISIYDVQGKQVKQVASAEAFAGIVQMEVGDLERGIYLVEVRTSKNILTEKLFIQ